MREKEAIEGQNQIANKRKKVILNLDTEKKVQKTIKKSKKMMNLAK
jgi:hypothetical protein